MRADQPSSPRVPQFTAGNACPQLRRLLCLTLAASSNPPARQWGQDIPVLPLLGPVQNPLGSRGIISIASSSLGMPPSCLPSTDSATRPQGEVETVPGLLQAPVLQASGRCSEPGEMLEWFLVVNRAQKHIHGFAELAHINGQQDLCSRRHLPSPLGADPSILPLLQDLHKGAEGKGRGVLSGHGNSRCCFR